MRTLLLATPTDAVMTAMLGVLERMCNREEVEEIGASMEESDERDAIYEHHRAAAVALAAANVAAGDAVAADALAVAAAPITINADPYDVLAHFLAN